MADWVGLIFLFAVMFVALASGMYMGVALTFVGLVVGSFTFGPQVSLNILPLAFYHRVADFSLVTVPLFLLMGQLIYVAGFSDDLFATATRYLRKLPGSLALAVIAANAAFAAGCGSTVAAAASFTKTAYPPMQKAGYHKGFAIGTIAAGGVLSIMIPPSVMLLIYGIITSTSIAKLLVAGVFPGLLTAALFMVTSVIIVRLRPEWAPRLVVPRKRLSRGAELASLRGPLVIVVLLASVLGSIYGGIATPSEAAALGALAAFLLALASRRITWRSLVESMTDTATVTATVFLIIIGAFILGRVVTVSGLGSLLAGSVAGLPSASAFALIVLIYLVLGCIMEAGSMVLITMPLLFPVTQSLGWDPVWFGIIVTTLVELAVLTPPVGMNVFVCKATANDPDLTMGVIFRGALPYVFAGLVVLVILYAFPSIALWLPSQL